MKTEYGSMTELNPLTRVPIPTYLPMVEEVDATGAVADAYDYFRQHFGRPTVPGILKCFSSSPEMLRIIIQLGSTLVFSDGVLGRRMKEMIATYVSSINKCPYCLDNHAASLCVQGGDAALLNAVATGDLQDRSVPVPEAQLLEFVRKVTVESHRIGKQDIMNLLASGWDEKQIAENIHIAAMFACFNRVANAFGLPSQELLSHLHQELAS